MTPPPLLQHLPQQAARALLANPDTKALTLHIIIMLQYRDEPALYPDATGEVWPPDLLMLQLQEDFDVEIPEQNFNRIMALQTAVATNGFYEDTDAFRGICAGLYEGDISDQIDALMGTTTAADGDDLTIAEILWAQYEISLARDDTPEFSPGVQALIAAELEDEGEYDETDLRATLVQDYLELQQELFSLGISPEALAGLMPVPDFMDVVEEIQAPAV